MQLTVLNTYSNRDVHEFNLGVNSINTQIRNGAFPRWDLPMFQGRGIFGVDY